MRSDSDRNNLIIVDGMSGITRWAPLAVVLSVVGGFVALSWYAYHAGMQSVREEDLMVVEADKTPMKEKPADPGGMHFPNQDKTIFDTFASSGKQPPKVERVLPVPEEPLSKEVDSGDTSTWINDKLQNKSGAEQVIGEQAKKQEPIKVPAATDRQVIKADTHVEEQSVTYVAPRKATPPAQVIDTVKATDKRGQPFAPEKLVVKAEKISVKKIKFADDDAVQETAQAAIAKEEKPQPAKERVKEDEPAQVAESMPSAGGNAVIQLGAYRSEEEATAAWEKMHLKQKELSDKKPMIVRADLGAKGVYYRLRVGGLANGEAKTICNALTAKGQACILATL